MKRTVVVAAAMVGVAALSGAAALPGTAAAPGPVSADSKVQHTARFVAHSTGSHDVGNTFSGTDRLRSRHSHKVVGFDSFTGRFYPTQDKAVVQLAVALKDGIVIARASLTGEGSHFQGPILKGSGKYRGIQGTITGRATGGLKTFFALHFQL